MKTRLLWTAAIALLVLPACHHNRKPVVSTGGPGTTAQPSPIPTPPTYGGTETPEGPDVRPIGNEAGSVEDFNVSDPGTGEGGPLADVYFDYDSAELNEAARGLLEKHALWLQNHREAKAMVEGHCDERGTTEYNLALGEKRARAAYDYLRSLGVAAERLRTVSYGKEKPLDPSHSESAFAKNRRDHFNVTR